MHSLRTFPVRTGYGQASYRSGLFLASTTRHLPTPLRARTIGSLLASLVTSRRLARSVLASKTLRDCIYCRALRHMVHASAIGCGQGRIHTDHSLSSPRGHCDPR